MNAHQVGREDPRAVDWFVTYTGRRVWLTDPRPEDIEIEDIAHALSNICRFGGHCSPFYSVAQHSVFVAFQVPQELRLAALLHDATEAYLGDVIRPLKRLLSESSMDVLGPTLAQLTPSFAAILDKLVPNYRLLESMWWHAICRRFGVADPMPEGWHAQIKHADLVALATERRDLVIPAHRMRAEWRWVEDEAGVEARDTPVLPVSPETAREDFLSVWKGVTRWSQGL